MIFSPLDLFALLMVVSLGAAVAPMIEALIVMVFVSLFGPFEGDDDEDY